eukprot:TRINITY_DN15952_c0_g1_i1.p2 TRINITY_DN15952_c0_g1~~TRINITY_DN15952_c0_g1_i1.p2  ORF type:complete len:137 (+),score=41.23 TRINITY_DN15952_c0_g1_i1:63-473(+)
MFDNASEALTLVVDTSSVSLPVSLLPITLIQVLTELQSSATAAATTTAITTSQQQPAKKPSQPQLESAEQNAANSVASAIFERCLSLLTNTSAPPKPAIAAVLFGIVIEIKNKNLLSEQGLNKANIAEPLRKFFSS